MSPFLDRMIAKSQESGEFVRPRLPSLYEHSPESSLALAIDSRVDQEEFAFAQTRQSEQPSLEPTPWSDRERSMESLGPTELMHLPSKEIPHLQSLPPSNHGPVPQPPTPAPSSAQPITFPPLEDQRQPPPQQRRAGRVVPVAVLIQGSEREQSEADSPTEAHNAHLQLQSESEVVPKPRSDEPSHQPSLQFSNRFQRKDESVAIPARQPEQSIHVSIGRIEIRASAPTSTARASIKDRPKDSAMSLEAYMRERNGRGGQ